MDCSLPGSSVHGIFQARVLEWGAIAFSICISIEQIKQNVHVEYRASQMAYFYVIPEVLQTFKQLCALLRMLSYPTILHMSKL